MLAIKYMVIIGIRQVIAAQAMRLLASGLLRRWSRTVAREFLSNMRTIIENKAMANAVNQPK